MLRLLKIGLWMLCFTALSLLTPMAFKHAAGLSLVVLLVVIGVLFKTAPEPTTNTP